MEERAKRRKFTKELLQLNELGYLRRGGVLYMAGNYIRSKILEYLSDEESLSRFKNKIKTSKIVVSDLTEMDSLKNLLNSHGLNPTDSKFLLLK